MLLSFIWCKAVKQCTYKHNKTISKNVWNHLRNMKKDLANLRNGMFNRIFRTVGSMYFNGNNELCVTT